jgi:hypothetical protein
MAGESLEFIAALYAEILNMVGVVGGVGVLIVVVGGGVGVHVNKSTEASLIWGWVEPTY